MNKYEEPHVRLTVSYGYDVHSIELPSLTWLKIQAGEKVTVNGQGFSIEGEFSQDEWAFNCVEECSLTVTAEDGFEIFIGKLADISAERL